jgi:hypothetical protein
LKEYKRRLNGKGGTEYVSKVQNEDAAIDSGANRNRRKENTR